MAGPGRVAVVVPLQDEESTVGSLLRSLAAQTRLPDEVILVDAGSTDRTCERITGFRAPFPLKLVSAGRVFPGTARNAGVSHTTAEWVAFTDGGIVLEPDWLQELLAVAQDKTDAVFGNVEPVCDSFFRECAALAYVPPRDQHGTRGPSVACAIVRRSTFLRVGAFPPYRAAEDLIFVARLRSAGALLAWTARANVRWQIAGGLGATFNRFASYSTHNLRAGWARHWHLGVARLYLLLALVVVTAYAVGAGAWVGLTLPSFFLARALRTAWVKRVSFSFGTFHPGRILGAAVTLAVIDAAMMAGYVLWLWQDPREVGVEDGHPQP
jgi:glycosyltransferase involved in cell wall biosynthesis